MKLLVVAVKCVLVFSLFTLLSGCAPWHDRYGNAMSQADEFECDQKCGVYNPQIDGINAGICVARCRQAKGYSNH